MDNVIDIKPFNRALEVRKELSRVSKEVTDSYKEMAELLFECYENDYHKEYGYASFYQYVEDDLDIKPRKASFFVGFTKKMRSLGISWDEVSGIGWRKLGAIHTSLTQDNHQELIELARERPLSEVDYILVQKREGKEEVTQKPKKMALYFDDDEYQIVQAALEAIQKKENIKGQSRAIVQMAYDWYMAYADQE